MSWFQTPMTKAPFWSQIEIDADKDMLSRALTNLKEIAANMNIGNIVQHNGTILETLGPGPEGYVLTSAGPGKKLTWAPAGGALKYFLPVYLGSSVQSQKSSLAHAQQIVLPLSTEDIEAIGDDPAGNIRLQGPNLGISVESLAETMDHDESVSPAMGSQIYIVVDGAVSETAAGAQTDETAAARNPTQNDMNLPPMTPAANDKYYFGFRYPFRGIWLQQDTAGVGNWSTTWYYWNGTAWTQLNEEDYTAQFMTTGFHRVWWGTKPADWAQSTIDGLTWYWAMVEITAYTNQTTKPLGTQAWCIL